LSTILIFLIVIVFLVVAHELGHFLVAKVFGIRVDEFGVGYPPRARKLFTWKGTLFTLNWLPFGGFVKIAGEQAGDETADRATSFAYQKLWKRLAVIAAGIVANMVIAIILYGASFAVGFLASPETFPGSIPLGPRQTMVTDVVPGSPADIGGLSSGDVITALSTDVETQTPNDFNEVVTFVRAHGTDTIAISVTRDGAMEDVLVTPAISIETGVATIGIGLADVAEVRLPLGRAAVTGFSYAIHEFVSTIRSLRQLAAGAFQGDKGLLGQVSGPVGIAKIAGDAYSLGIGAFFSFVALISVNLAVINLLPFPALDGGRMVMELFAAKGKSRIPKRVVEAVNGVGFLLLILLMLYVTFHDIRRLFV
jgi:regulator of sigma E protease